MLPQADAQSGQVMERGGGGRCQDAQGTQGDETTVEADDKAVIGLDAVHQGHGQPPQLHQLEQVVCRDGDVRDLPGNLRPVADGNTCIRS